MLEVGWEVVMESETGVEEESRPVLCCGVVWCGVGFLTLNGSSVSDNLIPDLWGPHASLYEIFQQILYRFSAKTGSEGREVG